MDELKDAISKEVLDTLTMEDLWKSPRLKKFVEKKISPGISIYN